MQSGVRSHLWCSAVASNRGPRMRVLGDRAAYVKYGLDGQEDALRLGGRPDLDPAWGVESEALWGTLGVDADASAGAHRTRRLSALLRGGGRRVAAAAAPPPVDPADAVAVLRIIEAAPAGARRSDAVVALP